MTSQTDFETPNAARFMAQLCKHFAHKVEVQSGPQSAWVAFPFGRCDMTADARRLELRATAPDAAGLARVQQVVTSHLERFAFRENPTLTWRPVPD